MGTCKPPNADAHASAQEANSQIGNSLDPESWVERHADTLFRYALSRVSKPEIAEDLVQETLLAAWKSASRFEGKASERTWLTRILRNKIMDYYRGQRPEITAETLSELARLEEQQFTQSGLHAGGWSASGTPGHWKDPEQAMDRSEFWAVLHQCAGKLPATTASVFLLREVDGQATDEICSTLNITPNHLGVLLHRARLAIRRCLELHWFREPS